jgi:hypothetical protein
MVPCRRRRAGARTSRRVWGRHGASAPACGNAVRSGLHAGMVSLNKWTRFHAPDDCAS